MERKKTGRPSKGPRDRFDVRLPKNLAAAVREQAARRGLTVNDLVGELLAADVGVPYRPQEALPLTA